MGDNLDRVQCELKEYQSNPGYEPHMILRDLLFEEVCMVCFSCPLEPFCQPQITESLAKDHVRVDTINYGSDL